MVLVKGIDLQYASYKERKMEKAWKKMEAGELVGLKRTELKETLGMTGSEISLNRLGAGEAIPFIHRHRENEEVYLVLSGKGEFWLDEEIVPVREGSCIRISPSVGRSIRAFADSALIYACVQAAANSLKAYTRTDGVIIEGKAAW
jgi:mannose-6-phosphate isomerase-like protein (cupin superfamily)